MDYLPNTANMARSYCPVCEDKTDPSTELVETAYCQSHKPKVDGQDDHRAGYGSLPSGSGECGGEGNRRWNALLYNRGEDA